MKNTIRLTESQMIDLIKRVVQEQEESPSMDTLVGSTVKLYNTKAQDRIMYGEATILSVSKDSDTQFTMEVDVRFRQTLMPGNPGPLKMTIKFDCNKPGFELISKDKPKTVYNVNFENYCEKFCPTPKKRVKGSSLF